MSYQEKINIYVPEDIGLVLKNDARMFEILKPDMYSVNINRFLSMIIVGYYDIYQQDMNNASNNILNILNEEGLSKEQSTKIASNIIKKVVEPQVPLRKGKNPIKLSLKPTEETKNIINGITDSLLVDDYISQYFCKMFISYCSKPFYERERIVFNEKYSFLVDACKNGRTIMFSTIWNKNTIHTVIPYKIVYGKEEMYNYLLCEEKNSKSGKQETGSYRLNRIYKVNYKYSNLHLSEDNKPYFEKMIKYGPQFTINEQNNIKVSLNREGLKSFNRVYLGRPEPIKIEQTEDGYDYYFDCSISQIKSFFKKFEKNDSFLIYKNGEVYNIFE